MFYLGKILTIGIHSNNFELIMYIRMLSSYMKGKLGTYVNV